MRKTISNALIQILVIPLIISSIYSGLEQSWADSVIATIDVGDNPVGVAQDPENNRVYTANRFSDDVSVIDASNLTVIDTIPVGNEPRDFAFDSDNDRVFVTNAQSNDVSVIDAFNLTVIDTIPVGDLPNDIVYDSENNRLYVANEGADTVSVIAIKSLTNLKPLADAGPDQLVQSSDIVQLDGSNSSDPNGSPLTYSWTQTSGPKVTLDDSTSENPTFTAPETSEEFDLTFQLIVTNEKGTASEPDNITIIVSPISTPPPNEEPMTIRDIIKGITQNPLDITNSVESSNEIIKLLTDNKPNNDQRVCNLLDQLSGEEAIAIQNILKCQRQSNCKEQK